MERILDGKSGALAPPSSTAEQCANSLQFAAEMSEDQRGSVSCLMTYSLDGGKGDLNSDSSWE